MTGRTTVLGKVKGRCVGGCVTDAFTECAWWPVLPVGANRSERESGRQEIKRKVKGRAVDARSE